MGRPVKFPPTVHTHASGQAYCRVRGHDYYLGVAGSPEAASAYARLVALLAAGKTPTPRSADRPRTVAEVVAAWWESEAPKLSERGRERDNYRLSLQPLLRLYGPTDAALFGADELETVQLACANGSWRTAEERAALESAGRPPGWCANVVNRRVGRIKTVWRQAEKKRLVPPGSWTTLRTVPGLRRNDPRVRHTAKRRATTWDEVRAVCRHAAPAVRAVLLLQWWSGMRPGETYALTPGDLDRSGDVWVYRPGAHKGDWRGRARQVPLSRKAQSVLLPWLGADPPADRPLFRPGRSRQTGLQAERFNGRSFADAVNRAAKRGGVPGVTAYMIRHAVKRRVTRLLGLDAARALLGQSGVGTTNDYDDAVDLATATEAARKLR